MSARSLAVCTVLVVAACTSAPIHYYTLEAATTAVSGGGARPVELTVPVVPEGLQRPQLVLRRSDTQLDVVETSRWTTSFDMELQAALAAGLAAALPGTAVVAPPVRIATTVRQFDVMPGERVEALFEWTVVDGDRHWTCRRHLSHPVASDTDAVVRAMQAVTHDVALAMAASIQRQDCAVTP